MARRLTRRVSGSGTKFSKPSAKRARCGVRAIKNGLPIPVSWGTVVGGVSTWNELEKMGLAPSLPTLLSWIVDAPDLVWVVTIWACSLGVILAALTLLDRKGKIS